MTETPRTDRPQLRPGVQRKVLKPFGTDAARALTTKEHALKTLSRQECFDKGFITVKDLDDEELRFGRCRDENGFIPGKDSYTQIDPKTGRPKPRKTELIPKERYDELVAEHELRFKQQLRQRADEMIDIIVDIATDDTVEPKDRLDAAKYVFEWTAGKPAQNVNVNIKSAPWEDLLNQVTGIAPMTRAQHRELMQSDQAAGIVEAEFEEIDDQPYTPEEQNAHQEAESQGSEAGQPSQAPGERADSPDDPGFATESQSGSQPGQRQDLGDTHSTSELGPADTQAGIHTPPEPFTQKDGPTAQALDYDIEQVRAERLQGTIEVDNDKPVYINEGDIQRQPDPYQGHRKAQAKSYAEQARAAQELAERRKLAKQRLQQAKKQRKINRALGADAIKDEITGVEVDQDGQISWGQD